MNSQKMDQLTEENRLLQLELNRCEDALSAARAERDEIGIRYNAVSERVRNIICECFAINQRMFELI